MIVPQSPKTLYSLFETCCLGTERIRNIIKSRGDRSDSTWASPIVVVPKRSVPGEPPKRRLCVDYRAVDSLLLPVKKAF